MSAHRTPPRLIEPPPLSFVARQAWYPWLVVGIACVGAFIAQLDASIVQLALPALTVEFRTTLNQVSWVPIAYLLTLAALLPVFGRLCEMWGRKLLYTLGFLLFTIASALCGLADSLGWLVTARLLQGVGGAMLAANSIAIMTAAVGQSGRARALGWFAAAQAIGLSAGPPIGGLLLSTLGWRWIFWVTVPVGAAITAIGLLSLPQSTGLVTGKKFDWLGAMLLIPALVGVVLLLNQGSAWGFTSPAMLWTACATLVLLMLLFRHELRTDSPLVTLRAFASPAFACGVIGVLLSAALLYGIFFIVSFGLVRGYHRPVEIAGLRLALIPIVIGFVAPFSGTLAERFGARCIGVAGMALCIASLSILAVIATAYQAQVTMGAIAFALFGVGLGLFITPNNHRTLNAAPADVSGESGAVVNLMRVLGGCLGVASASTVLTWEIQRMTGNHSDWAIFAGRPLLEAVESGFLLLMAYALVAGALSLIRTKRAAVAADGAVGRPTRKRSG
ncbi:MAG: MFS transporter [Alphaproteobacteria bacterium]|nr:MFS transporter [Alphaproteobacteria bacterium]